MVKRGMWWLIRLSIQLLILAWVVISKVVKLSRDLKSCEIEHRFGLCTERGVCSGFSLCLKNKWTLKKKLVNKSDPRRHWFMLLKKKYIEINQNMLWSLIAQEASHGRIVGNICFLSRSETYWQRIIQNNDP